MDKRKWQELFSMSRTERIGSYALIVIMVIAVGIAFSYRSCSTSDAELKKAKMMLECAEMSQQMKDSIYKAKVDSLKTMPSTKRSKKKSKKIKVKKTYEDIPINEVPQY